MASAHLEKIPIEVQQRVVSLGSFDSYLSLSSTSKSLRKACDDRIVIKDIVDNRNGFNGPFWQYPEW